MESNSQGRKKHMVEGNVQKIVRTEEVVEETVKDARAELATTAQASAKMKGAGRKKGFLAKIADLFKK